MIAKLGVEIICRGFLQVVDFNTIEIWSIEK